MHDRTELMWCFLDEHKQRLEVLRQEGASPEVLTGALVALDWLAQYAKQIDDELDDRAQGE